jgi:glycosyltransferase involved in cell wall biosynthesis
MPSDIPVLYCSDTIWNYRKPQWDIMEELRTDRKVMILNYQLGEAGKVPWTSGWDKYMFLNSTKEQELLDRIPDAYTKVLPPPTDLTEFFKQKIDYNFPLRLIRHNSQGDAKHPDYTNNMITDVLGLDSSIEFHYMPAYSKCKDLQQIYKYPKNKPPVYEFLSKGNCFWYHLPPGYQDQGPRVIIEAMACGMPVIADNRYGAKDRVTPETGWLCEEWVDYLKVISEIIENPEIIKIKGQAAREFAKKEYVAEKWVEEILGEVI